MAQPKFTKRHYKAIANAVFVSIDEADIAFMNSERVVAHSAIRLLAENMALQFHHDNAKFNKEKFMIACGLQSGPNGLVKGAKQ